MSYENFKPRVYSDYDKDHCLVLSKEQRKLSNICIAISNLLLLGGCIYLYFKYTNHFLLFYLIAITCFAGIGEKILFDAIYRHDNIVISNYEQIIRLERIKEENEKIREEKQFEILSALAGGNRMDVFKKELREAIINEKKREKMDKG